MKLKGGCSETFINLKFLGLFKIKPNQNSTLMEKTPHKQYKTNKQIPRSATFWLVL